MENTSESGRNTPIVGKQKNVCLGILAHVDAGKTTLSEGMLYLGGSIRKMGRVDNKDAYLDNYVLERARGITIFSKQAGFVWRDLKVTLLDTPGHVDFSAEMERTLQVLDAAVLVVSGADGVQAHTRTLWHLLGRYRIPVFLFINKMDQNGTDREALMAELAAELDEGCVDFSGEKKEDFYEQIAMCQEEALEHFLERGILERDEIIDLIEDRKLFPCYFGSALKLDGVEEFLDGLAEYTGKKEWPKEFGARVFKIARDGQGNRLTYLKITGGSLKVKSLLTNARENERSGEGSVSGAGVQQGTTGAVWEEKVNQIRIYSGEKYELAAEVSAGNICAVTGLSSTRPGEGLGREAEPVLPLLQPVLTYRILLPPECEAASILPRLRQLEEEEPQLHILWNESLQEIHAQVMGEVQIEVLKVMIRERFGVAVEFGEGNIVYKETILDRVEGVGHFEPLRHYAEVHLMLEPGEPGSGLRFASVCSEDVLDRNWQRLILTHLEEKEHAGVLTGSAITDMRITLLAGRSHLKHTEGGDFRQATYRAVRHGLMQADCALLEPWYDFCLEVPMEMVGRAMADMEQRHGSFAAPQIFGETAVLAGSIPVASLGDYQRELNAYSRGGGKLFCTLRGYEPCHNTQEVMERIGYDPDRDMRNPADSVFCSHGSGFVVPWDRVTDYMHLEAVLPEGDGTQESGREWRGIGEAGEDGKHVQGISRRDSHRIGEVCLGTEEIDAILDRAYRANSRGGPEKGQAGWKGRKNRSAEGRDSKAGFVISGEEARKRGEEAGRASSAIGEVSASSVTWQQASLSSGPPAALNASSSNRSQAADAGRDKRRRDAANLREKYLLVDGYNVIFAWEDLRDLAERNVDSARGALLDILCNYQGSSGYSTIVVFDAYRVQGHTTEILDYHNIHVVYTKEAETADQYIEKFTHENGKKYDITVATSDGLEQIIIRGQGCRLLSARDLQVQIAAEEKRVRETYMEGPRAGRNYLLDSVSEEVRMQLEKIKQ